MAALEQARWARLTPLERAEELSARGVPAERWPDAELGAWCDAHCRHLECLPDAELDILCDAPNSPEAAVIVARLTPREGE